jgi:cysteinyl-tRNA synthetase
MNLRFYNTLTREKEEFTPINKNEIGMYTCGPTVYNYAHIGNLRSYVFADTLRRTLLYLGHPVKQVMNITDIGHLASDADSGDDKMTKGLLREGKELNLKNMRELAEFYTDKFKTDLRNLNILMPDVMCFASDHIPENIELIEKLEKKGLTYQTSDGVYFNTEKFPNYGVLWGGKRTIDEEYRRANQESEKKNAEDFALWKLNPHIGFPSPWGQGFPGWHIECSAMSMRFLGEQFDIHTGGIDHISIHHTNEIAQSEGATGKVPFVKYWMHHEFVDTGGEKMAKSADNFLKLNTLIEKGIDPITYRFWLLMASYHTKMNFNWDALSASEIALNRLRRLFINLGEEIGTVDENYKNKFTTYLSDDLDTPKALVVLWDLIANEDISKADRKATILDFDKVLGLGFSDLKEDVIPEDVQKLVDAREVARVMKDFKLSDELRDKISTLGYEVKDTDLGQKVFKI